MVSQDIIAQLRQDITTAGDAGDQATVERLRAELATALDADTETAASPTTVTEADLRSLLAAPGEDARLVLSEGRIALRSGADEAGDGLLVITRADLVASVGDPVDESRLTELAALLDTDIRLLGA